MEFIILLVILYVTKSINVHCIKTSPPHIIYILGDDLGWNDLSYHGSNQIMTPNIDSLAYNGVILNRYYVQPLCTPSRAALMTGKYPIHTGQHTATVGFKMSGLPLSMKIMPEYLKEMGYKTHLVGKWHLGFYKKEFTPLERGFDTHFGYWTGCISYYDHIHEVSLGKGLNKTNFSGHDFRRNYESTWDTKGQYATDLFTTEAVNLIAKHPVNRPLFLYFAHLAVHAGNEGTLLEAPREEFLNFSYISNPSRRTYAAMVSKLDKSVGAVIEALGRKDMLKNSIIVFASDNGPVNVGVYRNWGSCYPFRGQKGSLWEGGVRAPAVIWSPLIKKTSRVSNSLMHISDWLPTLLSAAGYQGQIPKVDGLNQWQSIANEYPSPRENLVLDIYDTKKMKGYIKGPFKYIRGARGRFAEEESDDYLNFDNIFSKNSPKYNIDRIITCPVWKEIGQFNKRKNIAEMVHKLRHESTVRCDYKYITANCQTTPCLFNILEDPCEQLNLANTFPTLTRHIEDILSNISLSKYTEDPLIDDPRANPDIFNGTWSNWLK